MSLVLRSAARHVPAEAVEMTAGDAPDVAGEPVSYSGACFFIGIDFGTTSTGVAWAYSRKPDDLLVIKSWPGGLGVKVPSTIIYHSDGRKSWGFEAPPESQSTIEWFKLLLVDEKDMRQEVKSCAYIQKGRKKIEQAGKKPREVVRDYLALVWQHTVETIVKVKRRSVVDTLPFRVVLTVPAIWGRLPHVIQRLRDAAKEAGILDPRPAGKTELYTVAEPEAAAFATVKDGHGEDILKTGDIFIMCDAGGGTVDLITYEMKDIDKMAMSECVGADGDMKGSIFLDEEMEKCVGAWLGKRWTGLTVQERDDFKKNRWMTIKWQFDGSTNTFPAKLSKASARSGLRLFAKKKQGTLKVDKDLVYFEREHLSKIFSPVTKRILELVGKQVHDTKKKRKRAPKVLILVGGLGGNRYVYNRLKEAYEEFEIIQRDGDEPITAICRGAVFNAISRNKEAESHNSSIERLPPVDVPRTISRVPQMSYGVEFFEAFDKNQHHEDDRHFDRATKKDIARNLMYWYVKRGEDVADGARPTFSYRRTIQAPLPGGCFTVMIWKCDSNNPPSSRRNRDDIVACTPVICKVETPFTQLPRCEDPDFRQILFQLDLVANGVELQFVAKINGNVSGELMLPYVT